MAEALTHWYILLPIGFFVGAVASLAGIGGGAVMVPMFVLVLGLQQREAQANSIYSMLSPLQLPAMWLYRDAVNWMIVRWMLPGMLIGSFLGGYLGTVLPNATLKLTFGFILLYAACNSIFGAYGPKASAITALCITIGMGVVRLIVGMASSHLSQNAL